MMERRVMETTGTENSLLGFGCMRFPTKDGKIDKERSAKMIDMAYKAGVTYYDVAYPYHGGEAEPVLGEILKKYDRSTFHLATKLPCWEVHSLDDAKRLFAYQLERLQVDYFDYYLLHALDINRFREMVSYGVPEYLAELKEQGKIRNLGFSFHDKYESFVEIVNYRDWDFCQIQYNYMDRFEQAGDRGVELVTEKGIPLVIMEPIKGGTLAVLPEEVTEPFRKLRPDASTASWALRFVASKPIVKVILSGMSAEEQVQDNLNTFINYEPLTEEEAAAVDEVTAMIKARVRNGCTGCRYCMPCPNGVDIPRNFSVWNQFGMYGNVGSAKWNWSRVDDSAKAKNCIECGACEAACPQHLSIRENLAALQKELDEVCGEA